MTFPTKEQACQFAAQLAIAAPDTGITIIPTTHGHWVITNPEAVLLGVQSCCICHEPYREYGNNARPVANGRCCSYCDDHVVIPARIALAVQP